MNTEDLTASLWIGGFGLCISILALVFSLGSFVSQWHMEKQQMEMWNLQVRYDQTFTEALMEQRATTTPDVEHVDWRVIPRE